MLQTQQIVAILLEKEVMRMRNLINARKAHGKTQQDVADYLGITRQAYSNYEAGKREPDYETLLKIGEYFNCSTDYLLGNREDPAPKASELDAILKDELIAFYGEVKENLDQNDIDDLKTFMRMKAEIKKNREKK